MTFPVCIPVGPLRLLPHLPLEAAASLLGFQLYRLLRRRWGDDVSETTRTYVIAGCALGAAAGSRILVWFQHPPAGVQAAFAPEFLLAGNSVVGALLGGWLGVELVKHGLGERRSTGDLFVLPLCLGIAVGRVGCFLAGLDDHTYGTATTLPWGVDFGDGIRRHPTQLYEIAALGLMAAWALARRRGIPRSGDLFKGFIVLYMAFRFAVEYIKPDPRPYLGLTGIQAACLLSVLLLARDLPRIFLGKRGLADGGQSPALPLL